MNLGVFSPIFNDKTLDGALLFLNKSGVTHLELGVGGYPGTHFCNATEICDNDEEINKLTNTFKKYNISISALSTHNNPVHPIKEVREKADLELKCAVKLAKKLGIKVIVGFSGCPGDSSDSKNPNWVTCPWPNEYSDILEYQWNDVLIPYFKQFNQLLEENDLYYAIEMHPGFCVYNPHTMLKLRMACGNRIGVNFDPSHLLWQQINPVNAILTLKDCLYHFHAKDTQILEYNNSVNGILDTKSYADEINRSWIFRTVGYGSDAVIWKNIFSALNMIGYNGSISIEHEDSLMSTTEGLNKAIEFLRKNMIFEDKLHKAWWI